MKQQYYIVPEDIALANQDRRDGDKGLFFVQDIHGRYVVGVEVAPLWTDIDWQAMEITQLGLEDFPAPENILNNGAD